MCEGEKSIVIIIMQKGWNLQIQMQYIFIRNKSLFFCLSIHLSLYIRHQCEIAHMACHMEATWKIRECACVYASLFTSRIHLYAWFCHSYAFGKYYKQNIERYLIIIPAAVWHIYIQIAQWLIYMRYIIIEKYSYYEYILYFILCIW